MFVVLRRVSDKALLQTVDADRIPGLYRTTQVLDEAKLFKLTLEPEHQDMPHERSTTGGIVCEVEGGLPAGLLGQWEMLPVEVRLA